MSKKAQGSRKSQKQKASKKQASEAEKARPDPTQASPIAQAISERAAEVKPTRRLKLERRRRFHTKHQRYSQLTAFLGVFVSGLLVTAAGWWLEHKFGIDLAKTEEKTTHLVDGVGSDLRGLEQDFKRELEKIRKTQEEDEQQRTEWVEQLLIEDFDRLRHEVPSLMMASELDQLIDHISAQRDRLYKNRDRLGEDFEIYDSSLGAIHEYMRFVAAGRAADFVKTLGSLDKAIRIHGEHDSTKTKFKKLYAYLSFARGTVVLRMSDTALLANASDDFDLAIVLDPTDARYFVNQAMAHLMRARIAPYSKKQQQLLDTAIQHMESAERRRCLDKRRFVNDATNFAEILLCRAELDQKPEVALERVRLALTKLSDPLVKNSNVPEAHLTTAEANCLCLQLDSELSEEQRDECGRAVLNGLDRALRLGFSFKSKSRSELKKEFPRIVHSDTKELVPVILDQIRGKASSQQLASCCANCSNCKLAGSARKQPSDDSMDL